jgi:uncharacterized protein (TIGR02246 family)
MAMMKGICGSGAVQAKIGAAVALLLIVGCARKEAPVDRKQIQEFAARYTAAWCSQDPARVAGFFAEDGSLKINDGKPSVGRVAISAAAQSFMTALPDLVVAMDGVALDGAHAVYRWTLTGTNTGPGGTGNAVRVSGYEEWTFDGDGLIAQSRGHFDAAEYERQLNAGIGGSG